jgi:ankyrin repeat protein
MLQVMIDNGASVTALNKNGQTPLHSICMSKTPSFDAVEMILEIDSLMMFLTDNCGNTALSCVPKSAWAKWNTFLERKIDYYWPRLIPCEKSHKIALSESVHEKRSVSNPKNALNLQLASLVASGLVEPEKARSLMSFTGGNTSSTNSDETDIESDSDSESP